jgi:hypothetical protein
VYCLPDGKLCERANFLAASPLTEQGVRDFLSFVLFDKNKTDILGKDGTPS